MSTEEQDRIRGRLHRESGECRSACALLQAKLIIFAEELESAARQLRNAIRPPDDPSNIPVLEQAEEALRKVAGQSGQMLDTIAELKQERDRARRLSESLRDLGQR